MSEILYELYHSGESPPQCVCAVCRKVIAGESRHCDLCHRQMCAKHGTQVEPDLFVCDKDRAEYAFEVASVLEADRWMKHWLGHLDKLDGWLADESQPLHMRLGRARGFADALRQELNRRLIGRTA